MRYWGPRLFVAPVPSGDAVDHLRAREHRAGYR